VSSGTTIPLMYAIILIKIRDFNLKSPKKLFSSYNYKEMNLLNLFFNIYALFLLITIFMIVFDKTVNKRVKKEQIIIILSAIGFGYIIYRVIDAYMSFLEYILSINYNN